MEDCDNDKLRLFVQLQDRDTKWLPKHLLLSFVSMQCMSVQCDSQLREETISSAMPEVCIQAMYTVSGVCSRWMDVCHAPGKA